MFNDDEVHHANIRGKTLTTKLHNGRRSLRDERQRTSFRSHPLGKTETMRPHLERPDSCKIENDDSCGFVVFQKATSERRMKSHRRCSTGHWADELQQFRRGSACQTLSLAPVNKQHQKKLEHGNDSITLNSQKDGFISESEDGYMSHLSSTTGTSLSSFLSQGSEQLQEDDSLSIVCLHDDHDTQANNHGSYSILQLTQQGNRDQLNDNRRTSLSQRENRSHRNLNPAHQSLQKQSRRLTMPARAESSNRLSTKAKSRSQKNSNVEENVSQSSSRLPRDIDKAGRLRGANKSTRGRSTRKVKTDEKKTHQAGQLRKTNQQHGQHEARERKQYVRQASRSLSRERNQYENRQASRSLSRPRPRNTNGGSLHGESVFRNSFGAVGATAQSAQRYT